MAEHCPVQSESLQPHTERSSRPGPEPSSVDADVYIWRYALLVVHARKEAEVGLANHNSNAISAPNSNNARPGLEISQTYKCCITYSVSSLI